MRYLLFCTAKLGLCLAAILTLAAPLPASAQAQDDSPPTSIKDNAALWYWNLEIGWFEFSRLCAAAFVWRRKARN